MFTRWLGNKEPSWELAQQWLEELMQKGKRPNTVIRHGNALRKVLPLLGVPKGEHELLLPGQQRSLPEYLEPEELERVMAAVRTPLQKALIVVLVDTGLRISEFLALDVKDIDFKNHFLFAHREKTKIEGWIPISEKALEAIQEYLAWRKIKTGQLFPYDYSDIYDILQRLGKRARVKLHPHLLRHTSAALRRLLYDQPIADLKELLGHKNINTTMIYASIKPKGLQKKIYPLF